jgi:hypothetical protein
MTTHEQPTMTDSPNEPSSPVSETPQVEHDSTAAPAVETAAATPEPAADGAPEAEPSPADESSGEQGLFAGDNLAELRARWAGVQAAFVDDPKDCVQKADGLVADLVEQLTAGFAETRWHLEEQWNRGEEASTEDLRLALMHYREFFQRLLAV